jgi:hypothetical protein
VGSCVDGCRWANQVVAKEDNLGSFVSLLGRVPEVVVQAAIFVIELSDLPNVVV